jgi:uncharacterized alkaline shock family protein YloU
MTFNIEELPAWAQQTINFCAEYSIPLAIGAIALLFCLIIVKLFKKGIKEVIAFEDESGKVSISMNALKTLIFNNCTRIKGIVNPRANIEVNRGRVSINLKLGIQEGSNLREIREKVRSLLEDSLRRDFGLESLDAINIIVSDVEAKYRDSKPTSNPSEPVQTA